MAEDDFVRELQDDRATAVWVARLFSGSEVYMDDGRPGETPSSAWLRLKARVEKDRDPVVSLRLKFRSRWESPLPDNAAGYYFAHCVEKADGSPQNSYFIVGFLVGECVRLQKWAVPELIAMEYFGRGVTQCDSLLVNPPASGASACGS